MLISRGPMEAILNDVSTPNLAYQLPTIRTLDGMWDTIPDKVKVLVAQPQGQSLEYYFGAYMGLSHATMLVNDPQVPRGIRQAVTYKSIAAAHKICQMIDATDHSDINT